MGERFENEMRAGYPDDAPSLVLRSPMLGGEVLTEVRVRVPLSMMKPARSRAGATGTGELKTPQVIAGQLWDARGPGVR